MTVIWNDSAREEVKDIYGYLFEISGSLADDWSDELDKKLNLIISFPEMSRLVPEFGISFIRAVFVRKYRLVYQYQDSSIRILAVRPMSGLPGKF
ncbi:type II toxin-antitoxin system RelE/ParE family toxin [Arsenicibacter rosenii]|uniref:Plasmid stabilization protein n=1 Tax=Arsenicibacter rosenii TaxID=1750698 RepID=A0A1S2VR82_9BACT|nr:type II toxin-antitoxin system RelE/ParE family toxin [Arsenicibacter rosenii]OIN60676.1 hypothetical protein BLX24_00745 [Arsenicibacter rosenii]